MRAVRPIIGVLLVLAGAVWVAQGLNMSFAPRSFMTADPLWVVIGAAAIVVGVAVLSWGRGWGRAG